jgi:fatty acid-binding protein DegV
MSLDLFAIATRKDIKFQFSPETVMKYQGKVPSGELSIQNLWKIKSQEALIDLEDELTEVVEKYGKSSRRKPAHKTVAQETQELRLAIVSFILDTLNKEQEEARSVAEKNQHNAEIYEMIEEQKKKAKASLSVEELEKLLIK